MSNTNDIRLTARHTPGPWHYHSNEDGKPVSNHGKFAIAYMDAYTPDEDDGGLWERETEANGNLVAAAPELLAALQAASDWIDAQICVPRTDIQGTIRAAIAKATGGHAKRRPV